jgi:hypothetical protein
MKTYDIAIDLTIKAGVILLLILAASINVLVGSGNGHRATWQLKAKELGVVFYKKYRK